MSAGVFRDGSLCRAVGRCHGMQVGHFALFVLQVMGVNGFQESSIYCAG
jgi:hypothetical protein